jgi:hypothetical protein
MQNRRQLIQTFASLSIATGLAGCSGATTGRGETLDASDTFGFKEIDGGGIYAVGISASHYCELEYIGELRKPEEGFEEAGQVDALIVSEPTFREILLDASESIFSGIDESFLQKPPSEKIESPSQLDIDGEFEYSGKMEAGNYRILISNQGNRSVEIDLDTETYQYTRDEESVTCNSTNNNLEIRDLSVYPRYPSQLVYHIVLNEAESSEYSVSIDILSAQNETNISNTVEADLCQTHFVGFEDIDLEVDVGDELQVRITVIKNGENYAQKEVSFTAQQLR